MKKKLRGLKRKWNKMLFKLNEQAKEKRNSIDEIFIEESFDQYEKNFSNAYKKELMQVMIGILNQKQKLKDNKYYFLWCPPEDIFESVILIFSNLDQVKLFFKNKNSNTSKVKDGFLLKLSDENKLNQFTFMEDVVNDNEVLIFSGGFNDQYTTPIIVVADDEILKIAMSEFL